MESQCPYFTGKSGNLIGKVDVLIHPRVMRYRYRGRSPNSPSVTVRDLIQPSHGILKQVHS